MNFTQIPVELNYPPILRSKLSTIHSDIVSWTVDNYHGTFKERRNIIHLMNSITYYYVVGDSIPDEWSSEDPFKVPLDVDDDKCKATLDNLYIIEKDIRWDIETTIPDNVVQADVATDVDKPTPREDLYIQSPKVPRFDKTQIWMSANIGDDQFAIYKSLPEVPTKQNEISLTTDVNLMTKQDIMRLYPNCVVQTRAACMYTQIDGIELHPVLGCILPIEGYTRDQLIDNMVRYPHIFRLKKHVDGNIDNFYKTIELSGVLYNISNVWDSLEDTHVLPKTPDFMKEYVVRRYLLERDVKHIQHRYNIVGGLDPYLTLFAPPEVYIKLGYTDVESIGRSCVTSRVSYKASRNPIIRRINNA